MHNMSIFGAFTHFEKSIEVKGIQRSVANSVQKMMLNALFTLTISFRFELMSAYYSVCLVLSYMLH